jgi:leucyl aminopeptidase
MEIRRFEGSPLEEGRALLAIPVFKDEDRPGTLAEAADARLGGVFGQAVAAGDFKGATEDALLFYLPEGEDSGGSGSSRIVFLGAGERAEFTTESLRRVAARGVRQAEALRLTSVTIHVPAGVAGGAEDRIRAAAEGAGLAAWEFRELKTWTGNGGEPPEVRPLVETVEIHSEDGEPARLNEAIRWARAFVAGECLARDLQWRPGNVATPTHLAEVAEELAREHGLGVTILGPREMEEEKMGALLAVAAGSEQEPRLIVLEHRGGKEGDPPLALVGKGLTFDTGGISLKPAGGMEDMKYDMSGGAAVLGAMKAIALLDLPVNVVGVVPSTENHVSGKATKPGDVIRTRSGKTVEVINTDAEGRLILADALSYAVDRYSPGAMVDCATLTGAVVVGLGHHAAGLLGTDEGLIEELREAGDRSGERCWPLPLWDDYKKQLESPVADLKNVGGRPAGTITAAWFLAHFVGEVPWAHLDIAGTAYGEPVAPYQRKGGFGVPTRLLLEWVRSRAS